jgi:hypothetical protein
MSGNRLERPAGGPVEKLPLFLSRHHEERSDAAISLTINGSDFRGSPVANLAMTSAGLLQRSLMAAAN